jgi:hypothetical protein
VSCVRARRVGGGPLVAWITPRQSCSSTWTRHAGAGKCRLSLLDVLFQISSTLLHIFRRPTANSYTVEVHQAGYKNVSIGLWLGFTCSRMLASEPALEHGCPPCTQFVAYQATSCHHNKCLCHRPEAVSMRMATLSCRQLHPSLAMLPLTYLVHTVVF